MLANFDLQLLLIFISLPLILSQCSKDVNKCFSDFSTNLDEHKSHQFNDTEKELSNICDRKNGIYFKFIDCINSIGEHCSSDNKFTQYLCETRKLKMRISRYNWKATLFHEICHNTSSQLSQGFIKHESCISDVLNAKKWKCDNNYDKPIKALKNWKKNINTTCSLWRKFRDCSKMDVKQKCGAEASNISDFLFHSHQSYFDKYNTCELEGDSPTKCWFEFVHKPMVTVTQNSISTSTESLITEQTQQSLSINISLKMISSTESLVSMPFEYTSNQTEMNATTLQSINTSNAMNDMTLSEEHNVSKHENELFSNETESETDDKNDDVLDNDIESDVSQTNQKLTNNHINDKLTLSGNENTPNSKESTDSNSSTALRFEFLFSIILAISVKFV